MSSNVCSVVVWNNCRNYVHQKDRSITKLVTEQQCIVTNHNSAIGWRDLISRVSSCCLGSPVECNKGVYWIGNRMKDNLFACHFYFTHYIIPSYSSLGLQIYFEFWSGRYTLVMAQAAEVRDSGSDPANDTYRAAPPYEVILQTFLSTDQFTSHKLLICIGITLTYVPSFSTVA